MIKLIKAEVEHLKAQREARDLWVAAQLWDWFEQEQRVGMMQCIRTLVGHGLDYLYERPETKDLGASGQLHSDRSGHLEGGKAKGMTNFLREECRGLDIFEGKVPTYQAFIRLYKRDAAWWDIGKCGGFFRMYGTFFEFFGKDRPTTELGNVYHEGVDSFKKHTMPKTTGGQTSAYPFGKYKKKDEDEKVLVEDKEQYRKDHPRARKGPDKPRKLPKAVHGLVRMDYGDAPGISLFKLLEWSTIRKIDDLYGLPEGADISGTTSDHLFGIYHTMYLMEQGRSAPRSIKFPSGSYPADLQQINERKPLIILLPLAQMVREYHHALLETAAALSLNDMIDYKIGFYSSLLAHEYARSYDRTGKLGYKVVPWRPKNIPLANTVRKLLDEADKAVTHMFCCSDTPRTEDTEVTGYAVDKSKPEEVQKFSDFARLGIETYKKFYELPETIKKADLGRKIRAAGLEPPK